MRRSRATNDDASSARPLLRFIGKMKTKPQTNNAVLFFTLKMIIAYYIRSK